MYAVVKTGGKQYRVAPGDRLRVEKLAADAGAEVVLEEVLMISGEQGTQIGTPQVPDSRVKAKVVAHGREKKIEIIKFRRRKHYRRQAGHRQFYTEIEITGIEA